MKRIVYIDMDGVVADFETAFYALGESEWNEETKKKVPQGFFTGLALIEGAEEAVKILSEHFIVYFLSTPQWSNPFSWMEKRVWLEEKFGDLVFKKLILTHDKGLVKGDYLIDDNIQKFHNGIHKFEGKHIHFGTERFPNWKTVIDFLMKEIAPEKCEYCSREIPKGEMFYHTEYQCGFSYAR